MAKTITKRKPDNTKRESVGCELKERSNGRMPKSFGNAHDVVKIADLKATILFEDWEAVDWVAVNESIRAGHAVRIATSYFDDQSASEANWHACAKHQIGAQNVHVLITRKYSREASEAHCIVWIVPRGVMSGVLADEGFCLPEVML